MKPVTADRETRHRIEIVVTETVDLALPDEGGAIVSVEHQRLIKDPDTGAEAPEELGADDLSSIITGMATGTILQSDMPSDIKFKAALIISKEIIATVSQGLGAHRDITDAVKDDLTDEQQAALDLSVSSPHFKLPNS